jgi:hypothetical protein
MAGRFFFLYQSVDLIQRFCYTIIKEVIKESGNGKTSDFARDSKHYRCNSQHTGQNFKLH